MIHSASVYLVVAPVVLNSLKTAATQLSRLRPPCANRLKTGILKLKYLFMTGLFYPFISSFPPPLVCWIYFLQKKKGRKPQSGESQHTGWGAADFLKRDESPVAMLSGVMALGVCVGGTLRMEISREKPLYCLLDPSDSQRGKEASVSVAHSSAPRPEKRS